MARSKEEIRAYQAAYRAGHREENKAYAKAYRAENPEKIEMANTAWRAKNREYVREKAAERTRVKAVEIAEYQRKYRIKNAEALRIRDKAKREKNREKYIEKARKFHALHYLKNKEKILAKNKKWGKENPDKRKAIGAKRRAAVLQRTPAWADLKKIEDVYAEATRVEKLGVTIHVDHIIPLQGRKVSGLHVASNLQLLSHWENWVKGNKFDPNTWIEPIYKGTLCST